MDGNTVTYLTAFELNIFQKQNKKIIDNNNITTNFYRKHANHSIMCRYFRVGFIDFLLKGKSLLDYTNLFSPNEFEKNDKIILKYFQ